MLPLTLQVSNYTWGVHRASFPLWCHPNCLPISKTLQLPQPKLSTDCWMTLPMHAIIYFTPKFNNLIMPVTRAIQIRTIKLTIWLCYQQLTEDASTRRKGRKEPLSSFPVGMDLFVLLMFTLRLRPTRWTFALMPIPFIIPPNSNHTTQTIHYYSQTVSYLNPVLSSPKMALKSSPLTKSSIRVAVVAVGSSSCGG